ncbi:3-phosphoserine/phosphohydroxythreonine transaminase [Succinivibrio dextrinosolvens]|uniref:Phosphoserine aminotransferase n=1 Tax=Succinivibrio dextrinosolvens DSM 3072 TaxID=1123324 RepID=A0A1T4VMG1_9GAMM|nr:3-phosphoserine/phosphohydroxythreonine transaminase [Succinivibrio dextrinosolvens]SKA66048.1 phosphoserine aminotransferase apoenzyme [Succinivibrio dextrinosolvens DSM 3072]
MSKVWNFYAGPCMLPDEVMEEAQRDFRDFQNTGMGVVEISHRSAEFSEIASKAESLLRELLHIPTNYRVLFEQGGGRGQFAAIPLNLLPENGQADYFVTGHWSNCAAKECAEKYGKAIIHECTYLNSDGQYDVDFSKMTVTPGSTYAYICINETVNGIETLENLPDTGNVPLIADMSSNIMTRPIDVSKFGAIIFGLQKNVGPSGMTITIVREDLVGHARKYCPSVLDWAVLDKYGSMFNTPCTFAWYMAYLNFKWIKSLGGVEELERRNIEKAKMLYNYIDGSDFYVSKISKNVRSRVNCVFTLKDETLNNEFIAQSKALGLVGLKGHKVLGGMRASIYNAMPIEGVKALVDFLKDFEQRYK